MNAPATGNTEGQNSYTALVYFHGIGEQKRYEEVSRLVDALQRYDRRLEPRMQDVSFEFERPRSNLSRDVGYIHVSCADKNDKSLCADYRFYDAYYANQIAGGVRPIEVFLWLLSLSLNPLRMLKKSWREVPRLRRAILLGGWNSYAKEQDGSPTDRRNLLLNAYNDLGKLENHERYPRGGFQDYLKLLRTSQPSSQVIKDARWWLSRFVTAQFTILFLILTLLLTLGLLMGAVLTFIVQLPTQTLPTWLTLVLGGVILLMLYGVRGFLRHYVGDLYLWTTYQETAEKNQKRRAILDHSVEFMSHVLQDKNCVRVVVIGHSMGTTVSHDAILELARRNRAVDLGETSHSKPDLNKIQHFITFGSPIDKVHYLFETESSPSYHYNYVIENIRGDLGTPPFSKRFQREDPPSEFQVPQIHWINFWDQADLASSPLYTPTNHRLDQQHNNMVDNYEVAGYCLPLPASAHSDYIRNTNVVARIYSVLIDNEYNFNSVLNKSRGDLDVSSLLIGAEEAGTWSTTVFQRLAVVLPWLILLRLIFFGLNMVAIGSVLSYALWINLGLILVFGLLDWRLRYLRSKGLPEEKAQNLDQMAAA